ncbi:hypothetical protein AAMO2058_001085100 [Amorphochlora amoebiformis]
MGGKTSVPNEATQLAGHMGPTYDGKQIERTPRASWIAKEVMIVVVSAVACLLSSPITGFPALVSMMRDEHVFQSYCKGDDCKVQAALLASTAVIALWCSHAGGFIWKHLEEETCGSAGIALSACVLLTIGWGFLVSNHKDFFCMIGFSVASWGGVGVTRSVLNTHKQFETYRRSFVRTLLMIGTQASPIVFAILTACFRKHVISMKTLFTAFGVLTFLTGCILYVLVLAPDQPPPWHRPCHASPISSRMRSEAERTQLPRSGGGGTHVTRIPPPLALGSGGNIAEGADVKYPDGFEYEDPIELQECGLFSAVLPYTLRDPESRRSLCVSTSPDRGGLLMPTGIWESVGGLNPARQSGLFVMLTFWLGVTQAVVWHYIATLGSQSTRIRSEGSWNWRYDTLPMLFGWSLPVISGMIPLVGRINVIAPSALFYVSSTCAIAYAFFASLEGPVASVATLTLAIVLHISTTILVPVLLEQVYGSFRLVGLTESVHTRAACLATPLVMASIWIPVHYVRNITEGKIDNDIDLGTWAKLYSSDGEIAVASIIFGVGSAAIGIIVAKMLHREEKPKLKEALEELFRLVRVDIDGFVEWEEFWQVARFFGIVDPTQISRAWADSVIAQQLFDTGSTVVISPRSFQRVNHTNSLLPAGGGSGSTKSNGSFTAYINPKNAPPGWQGRLQSRSGRRSPTGKINVSSGAVGSSGLANRRRLVSSESKAMYETGENAVMSRARLTANAAELGISVLGRGMSSAIETENEGEIERVRLEIVVRQMWKEISKTECPCCLSTVAEKRFETILIKSTIRELRRRQLHGESLYFFNDMASPDILVNFQNTPQGSDQGGELRQRAHSITSPSSATRGHLQRSLTHWMDSEEDWTERGEEVNDAPAVPVDVVGGVNVAGAPGNGKSDNGP